MARVPGVDRSGDALRNGNAYGSSPKGRVLVVAGDRPRVRRRRRCRHKSDVAFNERWYGAQRSPCKRGAKFLSFGAYGLALSRFRAHGSAFKAISETVESGQSCDSSAP